jgi:hypothetical protein
MFLGAMVANLVTWVNGKTQVNFLTELLGRRKFHPQFLLIGQSILTLFFWAAHKGFIIDLKKFLEKNKDKNKNSHHSVCCPICSPKSCHAKKPFNLYAIIVYHFLAMHKK